MKKNHTPSLNLSRRAAIGSIVAGGIVMGTAACSQNNEAPEVKDTASFKAPPLAQSLLVNRERASHLMLEANVDAIVCSRPDNIYYLTNYFPQLSKMGMENLTYAILPRNMNCLLYTSPSPRDRG